MNTALPDVSLTAAAIDSSPLSWVGMQGIALPVTVAEPCYRRELSAMADVQVDLPDPSVKGIHMSRLYRLLDTLGQGEALSPAGLHALLQAMVDSHRDCASRSARLRLQLPLLLHRPALLSQGLAGWKAYPVSPARGAGFSAQLWRPGTARTGAGCCLAANPGHVGHAPQPAQRGQRDSG